MQKHEAKHNPDTNQTDCNPNNHNAHNTNDTLAPAKRPVNRVLHLAILSGNKTCANTPGNWCGFMRTKHFGTVWWCLLFEEVLRTDGSETGWLQRCQRCLDAENDKLG